MRKYSWQIAGGLLNLALGLSLAKGWADRIPNWVVFSLYVVSLIPFLIWGLTHQRFFRHREKLKTEFTKRPVLITLAIGAVAAIFLIPTILGIHWFYAQIVLPRITQPAATTPPTEQDSKIKVPVFDISLPRGLFASTRAADDHSPLTTIFLQVGITNRGVPSSATDWILHYHSDTLDIEAAYDKIVSTPMRNPKGETLQFSEGDNISEKTLKPIATGETVNGWAKFNIPGDQMAELHTDRPVLTVQVNDDTGHTWNTEFHLGEIETATPYYPETTGPKISAPKEKVASPPAMVPSAAFGGGNGSGTAKIVNNYLEGPAFNCGTGNCGDLEVRENQLQNATSVIQNAGKTGTILAEGNTVQAPAGQPATVVQNLPGGQTEGITATKNQVTSGDNPIEQAKLEQANRDEMEKRLKAIHSRVEAQWRTLPKAEREAQWKRFLKAEAEMRASENDPTVVSYFLQRVKEGSTKPKQP
jgi:hypothetical protein